jgi:hypothetical protein
MRKLLTSCLTLLALTAPAAAQSSVVALQGPSTGTGNSIQSFSCAACAAEIALPDDRPKLEGNGIVAESRNIGGESKIVRVDNLWGGSPVTTFASSALAFGTPAGDPMIAAPAQIEDTVSPMLGTMDLDIGNSAQPAPLPAIDHDAQTSAVGPTVLSADDFSLRLN